VIADPDRGSVTTEAVLIVPIVVVLTMVVVQFVLLWHGRHVAQAGAQAAARSAAAYQATAAAGQVDGDAYLQQVAPNLLPGRDVQVVRDATTVTVTVHADVLSVIPFGSFTVDESATAPVEAFTPAGAP
jgi:Flp pilus assembly protein TadG